MSVCPPDCGSSFSENELIFPIAFGVHAREYIRHVQIDRYMIRWEPLVLGSAVELVMLGVGLLVSLPSEIIWLGVVVLLSTGFFGGYVAGQFTAEEWQTNALYGGLVGAIGGVVYAPTLWFSMNNVIPRASYSAFWGINYFTATSDLLPRSFVASSGELVVGGLAVGGALLFILEGIVAGGAAPRETGTSTPPTP